MRAVHGGDGPEEEGWCGEDVGVAAPGGGRGCAACRGGAEGCVEGVGAGWEGCGLVWKGGRCM